MSLSAADHRVAAELLADAVPGFEVEGLARWLARADYRPRHNVGPGQRHWLVRGREGRPILDRGTFGLRLAARPMGAGAGAGAKLVINARAETVATRPLFRAAFEGGRCLIPADGFFEWERREGRRVPHWFHRADGAALLFAAVFTPAVDEAGPRFSIITVEANDELRWIHGRMPALIEPAAVHGWLRGSQAQAQALLGAVAPSLASIEVSPRFNSVAYDAPIVAVEPSNH